MPEKKYNYTIGLDVDAKTLKTAIKNDVRDALKECDKIGDALSKGLSPDTSGFEGRLSKLEGYMEKLHEATHGTKEEFKNMKKTFAGFVELQAKVSNLEDSFGAIQNTLNNTNSAIQNFVTAFSTNKPEQAMNAIATALQHVGNVGGSAAAGVKNIQNAAQQASNAVNSNLHEVEVNAKGVLDVTNNIVNASTKTTKQAAAQAKIAEQSLVNAQKAAQEMARLLEAEKADTYKNKKINLPTDERQKTAAIISDLRAQEEEFTKSMGDLGYIYSTGDIDKYNKKLLETLDIGSEMISMFNNLSKKAQEVYLKQGGFDTVRNMYQGLKDEWSDILNPAVNIEQEIDKVELKPIKLKIDVSNEDDIIETINKRVDKIKDNIKPLRIAIDFYDPDEELKKLEREKKKIKNAENVDEEALQKIIDEESYNKILNSLQKKVDRVQQAFNAAKENLLKDLKDFKDESKDALNLKFTWGKSTNDIDEIQEIFDIAKEIAMKPENEIQLYPKVDDFINQIQNALNEHKFEIKLENDTLVNARLVNGAIGAANIPVSINRNVHRGQVPFVPQAPSAPKQQGIRDPEIEERQNTAAIEENNDTTKDNTEAIKSVVHAFQNWKNQRQREFKSGKQTSINNANAKISAMNAAVGFNPTLLNTQQLTDAVAEMLKRVDIADILGDKERTYFKDDKGIKHKIVTDNFLDTIKSAQGSMGISISTSAQEDLKYNSKQMFDFVESLARMGNSLVRVDLDRGFVPFANSLAKTANMFADSAFDKVSPAAKDFENAIRDMENKFGNGGTIQDYLNELTSAMAMSDGILNSTNATAKEKQDAKSQYDTAYAARQEVYDYIKPFADAYKQARQEASGEIASLLGGFKFKVEIEGEDPKYFNYAKGGKFNTDPYYSRYVKEFDNLKGKNVIGYQFDSTINESAMKIAYENTKTKQSLVDDVLTNYYQLDDKFREHVNSFIAGAGYTVEEFLDTSTSLSKRWEIIKDSFINYDKREGMQINPKIASKYKNVIEKEDIKTTLGSFLHALEDAKEGIYSAQQTSRNKQRMMMRNSQKNNATQQVNVEKPVDQQEYQYSPENRAYRTATQYKQLTVDEVNKKLVENKIALDNSNTTLANYNEALTQAEKSHEQEKAKLDTTNQRKDLQKKYSNITDEQSFQTQHNMSDQEVNVLRDIVTSNEKDVVSAQNNVSKLNIELQEAESSISAIGSRIDDVKKAGGINNYLQQLNKDIDKFEKAVRGIKESEKQLTEDLRSVKSGVESGKFTEKEYEIQKQETEKAIAENNEFLAQEREKYLKALKIRDSLTSEISAYDKKTGSYYQLSDDEYYAKKDSQLKDAQNKRDEIKREVDKSESDLTAANSKLQNAKDRLEAEEKNLDQMRMAFAEHYYKYVSRLLRDTTIEISKIESAQATGKLKDLGLDEKSAAIKLSDLQGKQSLYTREKNRIYNVINPESGYESRMSVAKQNIKEAKEEVKRLEEDRDRLQASIDRIERGETIPDKPADIETMSDEHAKIAVRQEVEIINHDLELAGKKIKEAEEDKAVLDKKIQQLTTYKDGAWLLNASKGAATRRAKEYLSQNDKGYQYLVKRLDDELSSGKIKKSEYDAQIKTFIDDFKQNDKSGQFDYTHWEDQVKIFKEKKIAQDELIRGAREYQTELTKQKTEALAKLGVSEEELFAQKEITKEKEKQTRVSSTPLQGTTTKPQSKPAFKQESGYDLIRGITLREEPDLSGQKLEEQIVRTTDFLLDKVFNEKTQFFTKYMDEEDIDQLETYGKVLEKIGYNYSELKPDIADDGHQLGFIADIVADSENAVTNLEEARRIILQTKQSDHKVESQVRQIDENTLRLFDAKLEENDSKIAELRSQINGLGTSSSNDSAAKFANHYAKLGTNQIDYDVDKANREFYQTLKQGNPNKKGITFADFSDIGNIDAVIAKAKELRAELLKMHSAGQEGSKEYITLQRQLSKLLDVTRKGVSKTDLAKDYKKNKDGAMSQDAWTKFLTDHGGSDLTKFVGSKTNVGNDNKFKDALKNTLAEKINGFSAQYKEAAVKAYNDAFNAKKAELSGSSKSSGNITAIAHTAGQKAFEEFIKKGSKGFEQGVADTGDNAELVQAKSEIESKIGEIEQENKKFAELRERYIKGMLTADDGSELMDLLPEKQTVEMMSAAAKEAQQIGAQTVASEQQILEITRDVFERMLLSAFNGVKEGISEAENGIGNFDNDDYDNNYQQQYAYVDGAYDNVVIQAGQVVVNGNYVGTSGDGSGPWALETTLGRTNEILNSINSKIDSVKGGSNSDDDSPIGSGARKKKSKKEDVDVEGIKSLLYAEADKDLSESFGEGTKSVRKFDERTLKLYQTLTLANGEVVKLTYSMDKMGEQVQSSYTTIANFENVAKKAYAELGANKISTNNLFGNENFNFPADKVNAYNQALTALETKLKSLGQKGVTTPESAEEVKTLTNNVKNLRTEIENMVKASDKNRSKGDLIKVLNKDEIDDVKASMRRLAEETYDTVVSESNFNDTTNEMTFTVRTGKNELKTITYQFDELTHAVTKTGDTTKTTTGFFRSFFSGVGAKIGELAKYYTGMSFLTEAIQRVRQGVQYVREIDLALTELKKVTDESESSYNRFLQTMSNTASVVGSTVSELTNSAAAWARLGYSMEEAGELAKNTAILLNVSEFESEEQATEALISSLQAFNYEAEDSIKIVDKLNIIGNNFAISSDGIAEGLSRSASTLVSAGNTLEESIAMLAAGNKVQQDPEGLGNALKVLSMRIRGTKTELEEAGEETDDMIENTSKLRDKVMALTDVGDGGVDILTDTGAYKSTYQILLEIAEVWDRINEVDPKNQAALLEILAGKTRGSQVASILQNPEDLRDAYDMALDSDGSAQQELETYLDSIQGRIDLFTNELQTFWMNLINSNVVKGFVNAGTTILHVLNGIMEAVDQVAEGWGSLGVIIPAAIGGLSFGAFKKNNNIKDIFDLFSFSKDKIKNIQTFKDVAQTYNNIFDSIAPKKAKAVDILAEFANFDDASVHLSTLSQLLKCKDENVEVSQRFVASILKEHAAELGLSDATTQAILNSQAFAVSQTGAAGSTTIFSASLDVLRAKLIAGAKALWAFLTTTPVGVFVLAAGAVAALAGVVDILTTSHKEYVEQLKEETDELLEIQSEIKAVNEELKTTKERIEELEGKGSLSFAEQDELNRLRQQNNELERQNKILEAREKRKTQERAETALNAAKSDTNFQDQYVGGQADQTGYAKNTVTDFGTNVGNKWEQELRALETAKAEMDKAQYEYDQAELQGASEETLKILKDNLDDKIEIYEKHNTNIDKMSEDAATKYGDIGYIENATTEAEKAWNEFYRQMQDYLNKQAWINGELGKSDILNSTFGQYATDSAKTFKEEFEKAVQEGGDPLQVLNDLFAGNAEYVALFIGLFDTYGITMHDLVGYFTQTGEAAEQAADKISTTVTSLDKLMSSIDAYKTALQTANNITSDGQAISEDYYNTLKEQLSDITVAEQDFSDAIEEQNGKYIVKNVALLGKLVKQSQKAQKATIQVAKAQAQTQYKSLTSQIQNNINALYKDYTATNIVSAATLANIHILQGQIDTLKETIRQYALLELQMSGMVDGYAAFEEAKAKDEQYDQYGATMIEALKIIDKGLLEARLGTASVSAAIKAFVPEEALKNATTLKEEIAAIKNYIDGDKAFSDYFTVDKDGNFSVEAENATAFIKDMQKAGVLTGENAESFGVSAEYAGDLNKAYEAFNQSLKDSGESAGITKEAFAAMIAEVSQFSYGDRDILLELTTPKLEMDVLKATSGVEEVTDKMAKFWQEATASGTFDTEAYKKLQAELDTANKKLAESEAIANKNAQQYTLCQAVFSNLEGKLKLTADEANRLAISLGLVDANGNPNISINDDGTLQLTDAQIKLVIEKLAKLEEPTVMRMQLRYDEIAAQIDTLQQYIDGKLNDPEKNQILISLGITNTEDAKKKIDELKPEQSQIGITYGITETSSEQEKSVLESYKELAKNGLEFAVTADVTDVDNKIDHINDSNPDNKEVLFIADAGTASGVIKGIADQLSALPDDVSITIETKEKKTIFETVVEAFTGKSKTTANSSNFVKPSTGRGLTMALGNAHATGNVGLNKSEYNAVVGELGQELVVDPTNGVYYTVGNNGTEMVDLPKGAIIYNHKQTQELLKNGHTSRGTYTGGLSFANGNAHAYDEGIITTYRGEGVDTAMKNGNAIKSAAEIAAEAAKIAADAADGMKDSADEFKETINWIEVLFTRIDNILAEHEAYFETIVDSTGGIAAKESIYNTMYGQMYNKASYSLQAAEYYNNLAETILSGMDAVIAEKVRTGTILIEEITDEKLKESIDQALEYLDQKSQYVQQYYQTVSEIADQAKEHLDEVAQAYENEIGLAEHLNDMLEAHNDLLETREGFAAEAYYKAQISASNTMLSQYRAERKELQRVLDAEVAANNVKVGDQQWFEMQQAIYDVDDAIIDMEASIEDLQNSINDLHWDRFDELINRFGYIEEEISNVIQLISHDPDGLIREELRDLTTDNWATGSGLTTIGLYAQEMERAQYVANEYAQAIKDLKRDYAAGKYNETEYLNKLNELIGAQYENIEKYYDAKDAIIELNEARVDAIRDGIEREIDAYDELIQKKKEALEADEALHGFKNEIAEKEKEVADLQKQLAAMDGDTTAATTAKKKQLQAELTEAQKSLEESYYSHSMEKRQEALDNEFSAFEEEKQKEIETWENWLLETETVVSEALTYVKENTNLVYTELTALGSQYGLTLSDTLTTPWQNGQMAIDSYSTTFEEAKSNFTSMLDEIALHWENVTAEAERAARAQANALQAEYNKTASQVPSTVNKGGTNNGTPKPSTPPATPKQPAAATPTIKVGGKINAGSALIYEWAGDTTGERQYYKNDPVYTVLKEQNGWLQVRYHKLSSGITGWFKKNQVKAYAKGTLGINKNQLALIDELGEELVVNADGNGRLSYLTKGTGVVPADLTEKIMNLALDPASALDGVIPKTRIPSVTANNFDVNLSFDSLVHADNVTQDTLPELQKVIRNEFDYMMKQVNNGLKRAGKSR